MKISLFDTSLKDKAGHISDNLGDCIIAQAISKELEELLSPLQTTRFHTHTAIASEQIRRACEKDLIFVGGTNLLGSRHQWKLTPLQALQLAKVILFGVGWQFYNDKPLSNQYRLFLKCLLTGSFLHSVRDSYTKDKLNSAGISNVINTGCPTMWTFIEEDTTLTIPKTKGEIVLTMLTDYRKLIDADRKLLEILSSQYKEVYLWPQGAKDLEYLKSLGVEVKVLDRTLDSLEKFIKVQDRLDYIGTRLHGGIKCLSAKKRSLILEVDNRAAEIAKDTGLPTCPRDNFSFIHHWIEQPSLTQIKLDRLEIDRWKSQFKQEHNYQSYKQEKKLQRKFWAKIDQTLNR